MTDSILAALSAALAVLGWGCFVACAWRLRAAWGSSPRRGVLMGAITAIAIGLAIHQSLAVWAWETGLWSGVRTQVPLALTYRALWVVGLLGAAGAASYTECGHRGWLALAGLGALAAGLTLAV